MSSAALVLNHLWQSTVFVLLAALLTLSLKKARARTRYWVWLAASLKFFVPFSLIVLAASQVHWRDAPVHVRHAWPAAMAQVSEPFPASTIAPSVRLAHSTVQWSWIWFLVWGIGFFLVLCLWLRRWREIRAVVRSAAPCGSLASPHVLSSPALLEPAVFGIFKPVLLLPEGLLGRLSAKELQAIYAHELCHVRHLDNLAAAVHMLVEAVFWFHPLVWWLEKKLIQERECACDEDVLRAGNGAQDYAAGILAVCKFCLASPIPCAAGVSGADLRRRIETIMSERIGRKLTTPKKLLVVVVGVMAIVTPVAIGLAKGAQGETFEVASIKPSNQSKYRISIKRSGQAFSAEGVSPKLLILNAYDLRDFQLTGGPAWLDTVHYDIQAKTGGPERDLAHMNEDERQAEFAHSRARLQALLADRFQLKLHHVTKELPIYALVVAKHGPKLLPSSDAGDLSKSGMRIHPGVIDAQNVSMEMLGGNLAGQLGRVVVDKTGLTGRYDVKLSWAQEQHRANPLNSEEPSAPAEDNGPSLLTAVQEQLGLKLVPQTGPVDSLVIDHIEKPSPN